MKKGNPEDLTSRLLREILDEMGELYSKSWKKGVLIKKVRAAREKANNTTCTDCPKHSHRRSGENYGPQFRLRFC